MPPKNFDTKGSPIPYRLKKNLFFKAVLYKASATFNLFRILGSGCLNKGQRKGSLRIEVRFNAPLKETINCIVYAEFNNILEIDRHRNVGVDYSS
ncbi:hypothetical protein J437_LFUL016581 [Ladona fulva]|uniref:Uncharacterized protein n=1 Tax=Ladona fulva TaxID=123851 RepID=A0A8K0P758_LADFU|nr:hypothetical protein J437_LFUL016581 [Ladona fulva]